MLLNKSQAEILISRIIEENKLDKEKVFNDIDNLKKEHENMLENSTAILIYLVKNQLIAPFSQIARAEPSMTFSALVDIPYSSAISSIPKRNEGNIDSLTVEFRDKSGSFPLTTSEKDHIDVLEFISNSENTKCLALNILCHQGRNRINLKAVNGSIFMPFYGEKLYLNHLTDISEKGKFNTIKELFEDPTLVSNISISGTITQVNSLRTFRRKNSSEGHILKLELFDSTAMIWIVFWDDLAVSLSNIKEGDGLDLLGAYKKENEKDTLYTNYRTRINRH